MPGQASFIAHEVAHKAGLNHGTKESLADPSHPGGVNNPHNIDKYLDKLDKHAPSVPSMGPLRPETWP